MSILIVAAYISDSLDDYWLGFRLGNMSYYWLEYYEHAMIERFCG